MTTEQTTLPIDGFWPWVGRVTDDILSRDVPGGIVLLIVAVCLTPYAVQLVRSWLRRKSE